MTIESFPHVAHGSPSAVPVARTAKLFEPVRIGPLALKNRIVMPPMTRTMAPGGVPGPANAAYYARRARGGVGLVITEGTWVPHAAAANEENAPRMYGDDALQGWAAVVRAVHAEDTPLIAQLWHVGQMKQHMVESLYAPRAAGDAPPPRVGPSGWFGGIGHALTHDGEAATQQDIDAVVEAFRQGALNAQAAGFDGVEIHAAHGYLFDQFFWPGTNKRTDEYGGSLQNRVRLAADTVREIRRATGPGFAISLRFSQWRVQDFHSKLFADPGELLGFLEPLSDAGVDVFHCSQRRFWEGEFGTDRNLAAWTRELSGKPSITVGSIAMTGEHIDTLMGQESGVTGIDHLLKMAERGDFDLAAVGRGLLVDPDWARKVREGRLDELKPWSREVLSTLV
ncbi:12-oxophytodienoate reductase [Cupriavidus sp. 30B13]|uniref:oxidoreductase n=1 Tax=Cupriavidus sp. 30B13 TaxID=3384241 RepID=UPI003B90A125